MPVRHDKNTIRLTNQLLMDGLTPQARDIQPLLLHHLNRIGAWGLTIHGSNSGRADLNISIPV